MDKVQRTTAEHAARWWRVQGLGYGAEINSKRKVGGVRQHIERGRTPRGEIIEVACGDGIGSSWKLIEVMEEDAGLEPVTDLEVMRAAKKLGYT